MAEGQVAKDLDRLDAALTKMESAELPGDVKGLIPGKPVVIEFWAPWCPHRLNTLSWLKKLDRTKVEIVAIAIESERKDIDAAVAKSQIPGRVALGSKEVRDAFGGPPAIPTLLVADRNGKIARIFYGAPPTLHSDIEKELAKVD